MPWVAGEWTDYPVDELGGRENRCSHCGDRSSCTHDDTCPGWLERREALAGDLERELWLGDVDELVYE